MKLGNMQPYFFPYLGYFSLIQYADEFILFDTPQYIKQGWVNRNRIQKQGGGFTYITVPTIKSPHDTPIRNIEVDISRSWYSKLFAQLEVYKKKAPYYREIIEVLNGAIDKNETNLSRLNTTSLLAVCRYLDIKTPIRIFSQLDLTLPEVREPDEWSLYIAKTLGYDVYVNPPGGKTFFSREKFLSHGVKLQFLEANLKPYPQGNSQFIPGLSIIDCMMFCNPVEIRLMLEDFTIS